jgi:hypothetical protein
VGMWLGAALLADGGCALFGGVCCGGWRTQRLRAHGGAGRRGNFDGGTARRLDGGGREGVLWLRAGRAGLRSCGGAGAVDLTARLAGAAGGPGPVDGRPGLESGPAGVAALPPLAVDAFFAQRRPHGGLSQRRGACLAM